MLPAQRQQPVEKRNACTSPCGQHSLQLLPSVLANTMSTGCYGMRNSKLPNRSDDCRQRADQTIFMISRAAVNASRAPASPLVSFSRLMAALISGRPIPVVSITCLTALRRRLLLLLMLAT